LSFLFLPHYLHPPLRRSRPPTVIFDSHSLHNAFLTRLPPRGRHGFPGSRPADTPGQDYAESTPECSRGVFWLGCRSRPGPCAAHQRQAFCAEHAALEAQGAPWSPSWWSSRWYVLAGCEFQRYFKTDLISFDQQVHACRLLLVQKPLLCLPFRKLALFASFICLFTPSVCAGQFEMQRSRVVRRWNTARLPLQELEQIWRVWPVLAERRRGSRGVVLVLA
jgi:hypothetical protein